MLALRILALGAVAVSSALASPQLDRIWTRSLPAEGSSLTDARVTDVLGLRDGGVAVASARRLGPTTIETVITKFDSNGAVVWEHVFGSSANAPFDLHVYSYFDLEENAAGEIFANRWRGAGLRAVWFDQSGQLISSRTVNGPARAMPDGGYVAVNNQGVLKTFVKRYQRDGTLVWSRMLEGTSSKHVIDALGNVFVFGRNQDLHDVPYPMLAARITPAGDVLGTWCQSDSFCSPPWEGWFDREDLWNSFLQGPVDFTLDKRGHAYMIVGSVFGGVPGRVVAFDRTGSHTWSFEYSTVSTTGSAYRLLADDDGSLRIVGVDVQGGTSEYLVTRLDPDGNELWTRSSSYPAFFFGEPVMDGRGRVFVDVSRATPSGSRFTVVGYDADGMPLGEAELEGPVFSGGSQWHSVQLTVDPLGGIVLGQAEAPEAGDDFEVRSSVARFAVGGSVGNTICAQPTPNSTGQTGRLRALGAGEREFNDLTLVADQLPANAATLFFTGTAEVSSMFPGGSQGTLCAGGAIGRYVGPEQVMSSGTEGRATLRLDLGATPSPTAFVDVMVGETRYFQAWHRDANPGATSNFTDAVAVTFR